MEYEKILAEIQEKAKKINRQVRFMELCGTHAETIAKHGIKSLMPENIKLISGPGCPVCVTGQEDIDIIVGLALAGIPVACYGDAAGVPGNLGSLEEARQKGADVRIVYDVSEIAGARLVEPLQEQNKPTIFWGLGFETTTPATAWAVANGLMVFSSHKLFSPAMEILLKNKNVKIDGFINPGHVSAIIGTQIYKQFKIPQVVAGFEALDVLRAVDMLSDQIISGKTEVQNEYTRLVKKDGNKKARELINDTFEIVDSKWRGLGVIEKSGLKLKKKYQTQDAEFVYRDLIAKIKKDIKVKPSACRCGEVLQGIFESRECPLFRKVCTPDNPQGACMVSGEGSCNIEYRYEK
ncbi:MAG: hydrogenase formation protein HypD [Candidatus Moranbacteria bacterium RIFOXYA12_FULL_44_15]|nr:MAG: hydrogenase formation protein HypD [Candidatus Moranbacteria bacterium RIFOXYA12_FULL_44_15]OGI34217.1 MAG: hydrogenase formation protein HypD [Candidatus Moranbacteria bacterium RIFOXYA2_FULL_43_15]